MSRTPFPARPADVVALSVHEFTFDLDMSASPAVDVVCQRFVDDANRALVWLIRFRALKTWSDRPEVAGWLDERSPTGAVICEVAASFDLNDRWEFDTSAFCSAVDALVARRDGWFSA